MKNITNVTFLVLQHFVYPTFLMIVGVRIVGNKVENRVGDVDVRLGRIKGDIR